VNIFENYVDVVEASKILKVHPETIKRLIRDEKLPATKFSNKWIIEKKQLQSFASPYRQGKLMINPDKRGRGKRQKSRY
jgi:excisionase family DNA binding protein